jgi:hypothetical protein
VEYYVLLLESIPMKEKEKKHFDQKKEVGLEE